MAIRTCTLVKPAAVLPAKSLLVCDIPSRMQLARQSNLLAAIMISCGEVTIISRKYLNIHACMTTLHV